MHRKKNISSAVITLLQGALIYFIAFIPFIAESNEEEHPPPILYTREIILPFTADDKSLCEERGYTPKSWIYKRCMIERGIYRECLAKNFEEFSRYSDSNFCPNQSLLRFPSSLIEYSSKSYLIRYPNKEEFLILITERPIYKPEDIRLMQENFVALCQKEQKNIVSYLEKTEPNCAHYLHLTR